MKPSLSSVRGRTTAVAVLLVGFILFVWAASLVIFVDNAIDKKLDAGEAARNVAAQVRRGTLPTVLAVPGEEADDVFIQVVDAGGNVVAATRNLAGEAPVTDVRPRTGEELRTVIESLPPVDLDDRFRVLGIQAAAADGPVSIYVGTEWERVEESVDALSQALRFGAPGLLVLSAGLVWWLVGRALRPVESIRAQVAEITETELDRRVPEPAVNDEIGRLARTMNDMLDRLQRATDRQRRFVADASHELRSPLTSAQIQLEVAMIHPEAAGWETTAAELPRRAPAHAAPHRRPPV
ncbi:MAG: HAMP domain-containing protein, partial [Acidimicrobiia bacterium]